MVKSWVEEFKEKDNVLICNTIEIVERVEKALIIEDLWYETRLENGCTRFVKSDRQPY
ncbi:hypothetical protein MOB39_11960 [Bacillus spizizenii]|nr:hypothetical protein [Bacillus spizizenii]